MKVLAKGQKKRRKTRVVAVLLHYCQICLVDPKKCQDFSLSLSAIFIVIQRWVELFFLIHNILKSSNKLRKSEVLWLNCLLPSI